ncbi:M15 family metallopeptidase [Lipingzhangella sp. LS1_29]|uniref:M15 family metallopeptidase n=1 Tax=Lipingzhangella rawalii TaxID=2055835 RepID=A0ABU2H4V9_9ACTN|nr:M15 family metallopeptidase [Lipingzhangella rawalii]
MALGPVTQGAFAPVFHPAVADDLEELRERADEAREELEEATEEYTEREEELEAAQDDLVDTLHELQQVELELSEMREPLVEMANTMYQQADLGPLGVLVSEEIASDLEMETHVLKLADDREALLEEANELRDTQGELTTDAQELQSFTQLERVELETELEELRERSEESTEELTNELEERGLSVDAYMAGVECDPSAAELAEGAPNGLLPEEALCTLYDEDYALRADAAVDFLELNERYREEFGEDMCITSAYRDLPNQQRVFAEQPPGYAAVPGTSNHGLGEAIDLCGGIQNYRSERWLWMEENGADFGWFHPDWAKSSPFEPWHWEYER